MKPEITTIYGRVRLSNPIANDPEALGTPHFNIVTKYVNNLKNKVQVQQRSGLVLHLPEGDRQRNFAGRAGSNELILIQELVVRKAAMYDTYVFFRQVTKDHAPGLQLLRDAYVAQYERKPQNLHEIRCVIEHFVTEEDFKLNGNVFYHDALDMVFLYGEGEFPYAHPYSELGKKEEMLATAQGIKNERGFVFSVEIIDSAGKYGDRFVSICNKVYKVVARSDNNKPDGIYIVSNTPTVGRKTIDELTIEIYAFEDAEKQLGLYKTYEDALSFGDMAAARKRETAQLDHEIQLMKAQALKDKMALESAQAERDRVLREQEHERAMNKSLLDDMKARLEHLQEMERMRAKEQFEQRSNDRKESSEMIKYIPLILTAIGTLIMTAKAFTGK